ncbi:MAG TPA: hypothetical protein VNK89_01745 [Thermoflexus sp.]|nr:hypothetical protein [Thermoflexus sp.]
MDQRWVEEKMRRLRSELHRLIAEGEDEEGLRLRSLLAELERWEAVHRELASPRGWVPPTTDPPGWPAARPSALDPA